MNLNSNPVSKRRMAETETNIEGENAIDADVIAGSTSGGSEVIISEDSVDSFVNVFTEDILPKIFNNLEILTARDLLNFRLVNQIWRDAATSVLLKHNMCEIALDFGHVTIDEDGNAVIQELDYVYWEIYGTSFKSTLPSYKFFKYFNVDKPRSCLSELNQLVSTSPKFPSTSISFRSKYPLLFGNLNRLDILHFFTLYGKKIKKLSLSSGCTAISTKAVQNLLCVHMPHLICLDIQDFVAFADDLHDETNLERISKRPGCLPPPSTLEIREILLGQELVLLLESKLNFIKQLIRASPNLISIREVTIPAFGVLHEMGKCHLIKELNFTPIIFSDEMHLIAPITQKVIGLVIDTILKYNDPNFPGLKLSKLKFDFINMMEQRRQDAVKDLNLFLSAIQDSLEYLDLLMAPSDNLVNLFIPPLPHLQCLRLLNSIGTSTHIRFLGDVIGRAVRAGQVPTDQTVYDFQALTLQNEGNSNYSADYIPHLRRVILNQENWEGKDEMDNHPNKMLEFFSLERLSPEGVVTNPGATLVLYTVTTLELDTFPWADDEGKLQQIFPNVSRLKIYCNNSMVLENGVWVTFPKLKTLEIFTLQQRRESKFVDSFFTGISPNLCEQIESDVTSTELELGLVQDFERTQPYIGDCESLKEFKITFGRKLDAKFASKVTALHGFQDVMHRTQIIFSFESLNLKVKEIQETRQYLDPVAAYVKIWTK